MAGGRRCEVESGLAICIEISDLATSPSQHGIWFGLTASANNPLRPYLQMGGEEGDQKGGVVDFNTWYDIDLHVDFSTVGGSARLYRSESATGVHNFEWRVVNTKTGVIRRWEVDLPLNFSRREVSRDGRYVVYNDADPSGSYGVLYLQETNDETGERREQLTMFHPIEETK